MRVLHLIKTGTGASWALRQIEILVAQGVEVHVVLGEPGPMREKYERAGVSVYILPVDIASIRPHRLLEAMQEFRQLVDQISPDVIHSHFVGTTLFMRFSLGRRGRIPRIFQVPGPLHLEKFLPGRIEFLSASKSDYWIASCRKTRNIYRAFGIALDRIFLSYYGTIMDRDKLPGVRHETRRSLGIDSGTSIVGMVAYMYAPRRWLGQKTGLKGHEDLIDALKILRDCGRDVVGVFVGGAWNGATSYEDQVRAYGKEKLGASAIFLGTRTDVPMLYEAFDLVVHPSHSENVGGAAESLLLGVPTVATNIGGFPDVVIDGETGYLSPPKSPEALADVIASMLDDPEKAERMAHSGQNLVKHLFDVERTGSEVVEIYRDVIEIHRKSQNKA